MLLKYRVRENSYDRTFVRVQSFVPVASEGDCLLFCLEIFIVGQPCHRSEVGPVCHQHLQHQAIDHAGRTQQAKQEEGLKTLVASSSQQLNCPALRPSCSLDIAVLQTKTRGPRLSSFFLHHRRQAQPAKEAQDLRTK